MTIVLNGLLDFEATALGGVDELIADSLGFPSIGDFHRKSRALKLRSNPSGFDAPVCLDAILQQIERNWVESRRGRPYHAASLRNWRWEKQPFLSPGNTSKEKVLEKRIAQDCDDSWVNQVPTLSGVMNPYREKHCNIDLVHRVSDGKFEFIELKIDSDHPVFAAFEIVKYGMVYLFSRRHAAELGYDLDNSLLRAHTITLSVLAPTEYYSGYDLDWLSSALSHALRAFREPSLAMDFRFEYFPLETMNSALECVAGRKPLFDPVTRPIRPASTLSRRTDEKGRAYAGSQKQIQIFVNEMMEELNEAILQSLPDSGITSREIVWASPLRADAYVEYRDAEFLQRVGLSQAVPLLESFWPYKGPCWDALARIRSGCLLVEAKSHVNEIRSAGCMATSMQSRKQIQSALERTKVWLGVPAEADWMGPLYQSANRYAHLYFLREIAHVQAFLINIYFVGDPHPDPNRPTTRAQWDEALEQVNLDLGLTRKVPFSASVFLEV